MKNLFLLFLFICTPLSVSAQKAEALTLYVEVTNDWTETKADEPVVISIRDLKLRFKPKSAIVRMGDEEIPSQLDDMDDDMRADELAFVTTIPARTTQRFEVTLSSQKSDKQYTSRVYAQMKVRDAKSGKHTLVNSVTVPGSANIYNNMYHHGPAFESELVGYRIYFNQKQTVDPYGKFQKRLELKDTQFYTSNTQTAAGYGDDVLMVGNSCGIGTLKGWDGEKATHIEPIDRRTERIVAYGPIRTVVEVEVRGWQYQGSELNMTQRYILYAGHRDLLVESRFTEPLKQEVFCTGVQNVMGGETVMDSDHEGLVGSWGRYFPVTDTVKYAKETIGIATFVPREFIKSEEKDKDNFLFAIFAPGLTQFHHHTMFTSRKEQDFGYPDAVSWFAYMRRWKEALQHPVRIQIKKKR